MLNRTIIRRQRAPLAVLGLPAGSTEAQVKERYKDLARRLHPDIAGGDAKRFQEVNIAYTALRKRFAEKAKGAPLGEDDADMTGAAAGGSSGMRSPHGARPRKPRPKWADFNDDPEFEDSEAFARAQAAATAGRTQTGWEMCWDLEAFELLTVVAAYAVVLVAVLHRATTRHDRARIHSEDDSHTLGREYIDAFHALRAGGAMGDHMATTSATAVAASALNAQLYPSIAPDQLELQRRADEIRKVRERYSQQRFTDYREFLLTFDTDNVTERRLTASSVPAKDVNEEVLLQKCPIAGRMNGAQSLHAFDTVVYTIMDDVRERTWRAVDVAPAISLALEGTRRVQLHNPSYFRATTFEYADATPPAAAVTPPSAKFQAAQAAAASTATTCDGSPSPVPRCVAVVLNDRFEPGTGKVQRVIITGRESLHPAGVEARRDALSSGALKPKELLELGGFFPCPGELPVPPKKFLFF
jgi:hypothetical protein